MNKTAGLALLAVMICANVKAQDMDAILTQADSLSKAKNYADAIALLEKNIKLFETGNPSDALAYSRLGDLYYDLKDFKKAIPSYRKYVDIRKPYAEQEPGRYAEWLYKNMALIGQCQSKLNDYPAAIKTYIEVIAVLDKYQSDIKDCLKEKANKYGSLAWYYLLNKEYKKAESVVRKGLESDSTQTWIKTNLAHALLFQGKTAEAEKIYTELTNTIYHDNNTYALTLLDDFEQLEKVITIKQQTEYNRIKDKIILFRNNEVSAIELLNKANKLEDYSAIRLLETNLSTVNKNSIYYMMALKKIIESYKNESGAAKYYEKYGEGNFGEIFTYKKCEYYYDELLSILKLSGQYYTDNTIILLEQISKFYNFYPSYTDSTRKEHKSKIDYYYNEAIRIIRKIHDKNSLSYIDELKHISEIYQRLGWNNSHYYNDAVNVLFEAKSIIESDQGNNTKQYLSVLKDINKLRFASSILKEREDLLIEQKNLTEQVYGKGSLSYAKILDELGERYLNEARASVKTDTGENYYDMAIKYSTELKQLTEQYDFSTTYFDYNEKAINNLIELYQIRKDSVNLINTIFEYKKDRNNSNIEYHYSEVMFNKILADYYEQRGDFQKAEYYLKESLRYRSPLEERNTYNEQSNPYIDIMSFYDRTNNIEKLLFHIQNRTSSLARSFFYEVFDHPYRDDIGDDIGNTTENLYKHFEVNVSGNFNMAYKYKNDKAFGICYDNLLLFKGLKLGLTNKIRDIIYHSENLDWISKYNQLNNFKLKLNQLMSDKSIIVEQTTETDTDETEALTLEQMVAKFTGEQMVTEFTGKPKRTVIISEKIALEKENIEKKIRNLNEEMNTIAYLYNYIGDSIKVNKYFTDIHDHDWQIRRNAHNLADNSKSRFYSDFNIKWDSIQNALGKDDATIDFFDFETNYNTSKNADDFTTHSHQYVALILRPGMTAPAWIPLCEQKQLQAVLHTDTRDTREQTETLYSGKGGQLYQLVWQALEKELPNVKNIYYSPSGLLHKIAFNALPVGRDSMLLSDKYNLHLVSSTREIARLKKETSAAPVQDTTVVYGGLTYDLRQSAMVAAAKSYNGRQKDGDSRYVDRFRRRDAELPEAGLRSGFSEWQYLSGTKTETEQIVGSLSGKRIPHQYYTESNGNEESFKYLSGTQTGVIHLATHGFFLPDIENKAVENIVQRLGGNKAKPFENPLLRSGLILSGANNQWVAKEFVMEDGVEDGILTADEISRLNLTKTKLVVLSACETGLGDVKNSEGVFGLQRAFKLAGVESLIMSLWKVPDEPTAELMTAFYNEWLAGATKQTAFKTAQQKVRAKYKSPYYWAAFVMMD